MIEDTNTTSSTPIPSTGETPATPEMQQSQPQEQQQQSQQPDEAPVAWDTLGLSEATLELIRKAGYEIPSPVQAKTLPIALEGHDVIASAQTGTGKTAAFVLPMVERFAGREGTYGLILAPTREIAQQIHQTLEIFGTPRGVRSIVLIGGINMRLDAQALSTYPQIIVATPGRLVDHIERGNVWLDFIEVVVLDEADRMLDMGFADQLNRIMDEVPEQRQTMLFSATIPPAVKRLAERILHEPKSISIGKPLAAASSVEQRLWYTKDESKNRDLQRLLRSEIKGSVIVFTRSKDGATRVWRSLHSAGFYDATYIHSDRLQAHREEALAEFKSGKYRILIATDVAARGIHVDQVQHVINYDLPLEPEDYVHRIGRTGRAGQTGHATSFVTSRDRRLLLQIEKLIGKRIPEVFGGQPRPEGAELGEGQDHGHGQGHGRGRDNGQGRDRDRGHGGGRREERGHRGGDGQRAQQPQHQAGQHTLPRPQAQGQQPARAQGQGGGGPRKPSTPVRAIDFLFPTDEGGDEELGPQDDFSGLDRLVEVAQSAPSHGAPGEGGARRRRRRGRRGGQGRGEGQQQQQGQSQGRSAAGEAVANGADSGAALQAGPGGEPGPGGPGTDGGDGQRRRRRRGRRGGRGRRNDGGAGGQSPGGAPPSDGGGPIGGGDSDEG